MQDVINKNINNNEEVGENVSKRGKPKQIKKEVTAKKAFIYLGPNIPGGILFKGSIYKEIPVHLEKLFNGLPEIKELFIEVKSVPGFKMKLTEQGSEAYRLYQSVENVIRQGGLKNVV